MVSSLLATEVILKDDIGHLQSDGVKCEVLETKI